jgi:hypothetical protein
LFMEGLRGIRKHAEGSNEQACSLESVFTRAHLLTISAS